MRDKMKMRKGLDSVLLFARRFLLSRGLARKGSRSNGMKRWEEGVCDFGSGGKMIINVLSGIIGDGVPLEIF